MNNNVINKIVEKVENIKKQKIINEYNDKLYIVTVNYYFYDYYLNIIQGESEKEVLIKLFYDINDKQNNENISLFGIFANFLDYFEKDDIIQKYFINKKRKNIYLFSQYEYYNILNNLSNHNKNFIYFEELVYQFMCVLQNDERIMIKKYI